MEGGKGGEVGEGLHTLVASPNFRTLRCLRIAIVYSPNS